MNSRGAGATLPQLRAPEKWCIHPKFDSAAGLGDKNTTNSGTNPILILRVTGFDSASGPIPGNGQHYHYGRGSGIGGERAYVGLGSRGTREPQD